MRISETCLVNDGKEMTFGNGRTLFIIKLDVETYGIYDNARIKPEKTETYTMNLCESGNNATLMRECAFITGLGENIIKYGHHHVSNFCTIIKKACNELAGIGYDIGSRNKIVAYITVTDVQTSITRKFKNKIW